MSDLAALQLPKRSVSPLAQVLRRVGLAIGMVIFVALVVRLGRDGYTDVTGDSISFLDAVYYASVTVTTTGYGDISAVSDSARLGTILLITPARILFLILVVSTTVEVLTEQSRIDRAKQRWRQQVKDHIIVCGYGETGKAAARDLIARGVEPGSIVVVDESQVAIDEAKASKLVGILGDASGTNILEQAGIRDAKSIIIAPSRDDTAVLITLTARELNPTAHITVGGREQENLHLLRQGGADEVIDATAAIGRMLGLGAQHPVAASVLDDLMLAGEGLELIEIPAKSAGAAAVPDDATVIAIVRNGTRLAQRDCNSSEIEVGDRIVLLMDRSG